MSQEFSINAMNESTPPELRTREWFIDLAFQAGVRYLNLAYPKSNIDPHITEKIPQAEGLIVAASHTRMAPDIMAMYGLVNATTGAYPKFISKEEHFEGFGSDFSFVRPRGAKGFVHGLYKMPITWIVQSAGTIMAIREPRPEYDDNGDLVWSEPEEHKAARIALNRRNIQGAATQVALGGGALELFPAGRSRIKQADGTRVPKQAVDSRANFKDGAAFASIETGMPIVCVAANVHDSGRRRERGINILAANKDQLVRPEDFLDIADVKDRAKAMTDTVHALIEKLYIEAEDMTGENFGWLLEMKSARAKTQP